jgi:response regulator RpfG family c-di-GMP phosphodiesterase
MADIHPLGADDRRILVVDDDATLLMLVGKTLRAEGYDVTTAVDPIQALEVVRSQRFAVVVSDQKMPQMTGLEFLDHVRQIQPHAMHILLTAVLDLSVVIDAINRGEIYRFLVKPWTREEVLGAVADACKRCQSDCREAALQAETETKNEQLFWLNRSLDEQLAHGGEQNRRLAQLNQALEQNLQQCVELCVKTMETFFPSLGTRARRVVALCRGMAETAQIPVEQRRVLEISAWLHDIGLVNVPRDLIRRWHESADSLNEAEQTLIRHHPIVGQELAGFVAQLEEVGVVIRAHHERLDGNGYPDGLVGDRIPKLARLLAVAVAYAESHLDGRDAIHEIEANRGSAYDPEAVRVLLRCLPKAVLPRQEKGVLLAELQPGMVLANGIYNAHGMLILPEGQVLNDAWIGKLKAHDRVSPLNPLLQVYS